MTELDILRELNARTGLVAPLADKVQQVHRHAEFTRRAAWALRDRGWGSLRKTTGAHVDGKSIDKIIQRDSGEVRDLIVDSDGNEPRVTFDLAGVLEPSQFFIAPTAPPDAPPVKPPVEPPVEPPAADDDAALLKELVDAIDANSDRTDANTAALQALHATLKIIAEKGVRLRL